MIDLTMTQAERDAAMGIICFALARPARDYTVAPCHTTLPMHHWLCDHGMAPGIYNDQPAYCVWDFDLARQTAAAVCL